MNEINKAFQTVCYLLFGKQINNVQEYQEWLEKDLPAGIKEIETVDRKKAYLADVEFFTKMQNNLVDLGRSLELGEKQIQKEQVDELNIQNASRLLSDINTTTCEIIYGRNLGTERCVCYGPTQNCYQTAFCWFSKNIGYSFMPRTSENCFGCSNIIDCYFCIKCYNSAKLNRCFEVSDSNSCIDCYFCHNCENLTDSMFCFNTKSKQYAIGNIEVGKERYLEIKKKILDSIVTELEKTKKLRHGIYHL